jgi:hypothetical protein
VRTHTYSHKLFRILDDYMTVMSPVRGLLTLISEIEKIYASEQSANQHAVATECARLRAWSMVVRHKEELCVRDADVLDARLAYLASVLLGNWMAIQFDNSLDAIFAKGSNIIATVHLHELHSKFTDLGVQLRLKGHETNALDELLKKMHAIEQELEVSSDDVLDYAALQSLNLIISLKINELHEEIRKIPTNIANMPKFYNLCVDIRNIQQRLALDK